ncbi:hypothetical protein ANN_14683 [Periplaneta americana]|uniref:Uncharacterized protein n=1 Tax=Periplaneta americana TaxID=6978 RepID=A0ABQ8SWZ3_PERAM|nr:hypothetical protein ANN_14683 [Periplaneta americana]
MAGLCEGGNEPQGSLKATKNTDRGNELLLQRNYEQLATAAAGSVCLSLFQGFLALCEHELPILVTLEKRDIPDAIRPSLCSSRVVDDIEKLFKAASTSSVSSNLGNGVKSERVTSSSDKSEKERFKEERQWIQRIMNLQYTLLILLSIVERCTSSGICHMSACDALQEMKNEISRYSTTNEGLTQEESLEARYTKLERRVRAVEQPEILRHHMMKDGGTEKNSLRHRDLNPGFQLYVLTLYPLNHTGFPFRCRIESS